MPDFMKRALKKRTQSELARELGVKRQTVSAWARGVSRVSVERCTDFKRITGVPLKDIRPDIFARGK